MRSCEWTNIPSSPVFSRTEIKALILMKTSMKEDNQLNYKHQCTCMYILHFIPWTWPTLSVPNIQLDVWKVAVCRCMFVCIKSSPRCRKAGSRKVPCFLLLGPGIPARCCNVYQSLWITLCLANSPATTLRLPPIKTQLIGSQGHTSPSTTLKG